MRSKRVVLCSPLLNYHMCFPQRVEDLSVQIFIPQLSVEILAAPVFPGTSGPDIQDLRHPSRRISPSRHNLPFHSRRKRSGCEDRIRNRWICCRKRNARRTMTNQRAGTARQSERSPKFKLALCGDLLEVRKRLYFGRFSHKICGWEFCIAVSSNTCLGNANLRGRSHIDECSNLVFGPCLIL